ncbi:DUF4254 domain-containing protein [Nocardia sp. NPDC057227]|uniref:DUF4254 domain-containing protein n=1 Tax=Nocardia sp. NPDC057227 TaxID=3346056 RepID=UPI00362C539B
MNHALPDKDSLVAALRGFPHRDHPMLEAAGELAALHEARIGAGGTGEIDGHRGRLVLAIDRWIARVVPVPHGGAARHTETVGEVVDRLASYCAQAYAVTADSEHERYELDMLVTDLADAYDDLITEVGRGVRRVPTTYQQWG